MDTRTWVLDTRTWSLDARTWSLETRTWTLDTKTWILDTRTELRTWILDNELQGRGSWIQGPDPGYKDLDPRYKVHGGDTGGSHKMTHNPTYE